jgi:hypothetical protein
METKLSVFAYITGAAQKNIEFYALFSIFSEFAENKFENRKYQSCVNFECASHLTISFTVKISVNQKHLIKVKFSYLSPLLTLKLI